MIEEICSTIHRIEVPLPQSPLKTLNAYCLTGGDRHLLIDTGFNRPECRDVLNAALRDLGVDRHRLDICVTHLHADHSGLAADLLEGTDGVLWCSPGDGAAINAFTKMTDHRARLGNRMYPHGFAQAQVEELASSHPGIRFSSEGLAFKPLRAEDELRCGDHTLRVVSVPGHTPDHIALYEPTRKLFFSGDHILGDITPNITRWMGVPDSLGNYLRSLDTVLSLDIALTLPGHRSRITDTPARIRQIQAHHAERLDEVRRILAQGPANAYAVAGQMTWSMRYASWEDFPTTQKWFATGEALSHLDRLVVLNETEEQTLNESTLFFRKEAAGAFSQ